MVSLVEGDKGGTGAYSFVNHNRDDSAIHTDDGVAEQRLLGDSFSLESVKQSTTLTQFKRTRLHWITPLHGVLYLIYIGVVLGLGEGLAIPGYRESCNKSNQPDSFLSFFAIGHIALGIAISMLTFIVKWGLDCMNERGYQKFTKVAKRLALCPLATWVVANALLLLLLCVVYYKQYMLCSWQYFRPGYVLYIVAGIEALISVSVLFAFFVICVLFNMRQEAPDILEDMANDSGNVSNLPPTIGYRDGTNADNIIERQAYKIQNLEQRNAALAKRILVLQTANAT